MKGAAFILAFLLPVLTIFADGKVFRPQAVIASTTIPDQRALLWWSNGLERLVIETRFVGEGTNFAWVVPLPAPPAIEAATSGMFNTLAYQLRPDLVHDPMPWFAVILFALAVGYLLLSVKANEEFESFDLVACLVAGAGVMFLSPLTGILTSLLLLWAVARIRRGAERPLAIILALLLAFLFGGMFLSSLGTAGVGGRSTTSELTEIASERVGAFDTTTLTAKSPVALTEWLLSNGFQVTSNSEPIIADYVKRSWVFVAAKLHRENSTLATNAIHPLSFTFPTKEAVYPLRLTGVDNGPLKVELYVFGNERAEADHFRVEACLELKFADQNNVARREDGFLAVMHPRLKRIAQGSRVVTKLAATLSPAQMREDAVVGWRSFGSRLQTVYSRRGAWITAANWGTGVLLVVALISAFRQAGLKGVKPEWNANRALATIAVGLIVFVTAYAMLPKVEVRLGRFFYDRTISELKSLGANAVAEWESSPPKPERCS